MLSDFHDWDTQCPTLLFPVVRHSQCFALRVTDILESQLPVVGSARFRFLNSMRTVDTHRDALRARFTQLQETHQKNWQRDWRTLQSPTHSLQTHDALLPALRRLMLARPRAVVDTGAMT